MANTSVINTLSVWVKFPVLSMEYYNEQWLIRATNRRGRTLRVDETMLIASKEKFARVCVEIDLEATEGGVLDEETAVKNPI